jgi:1-phosphofructokinase family hexose kinase
VPSGKGFNVARALTALGVRTLALGVVGEKDVSTFLQMRNETCEIELVQRSGRTRESVTLLDSAKERVTHVRAPGEPVDPADLQRLAALALRSASAGDVMVLSGSLPPAARPAYYAEIVEECRKFGVKSLLDTSGTALEHGSSAGADVVKPNLHELEQLAGPLCGTFAIAAAVRARFSSRSVVVVSMGSEGALLLRHGQAPLLANLAVRDGGYPASRPGTGDAMVAGLALALLRGSAVDEMLRGGVACGSASLFESVPGALDASRVAELRRQVVIQELDA